MSEYRGKEWLLTLQDEELESRTIPKDREQNVILLIHYKGDTSNCRNHRPICLSVVAFNVCIRIVKKQLRHIVEEAFYNNQLFWVNLIRYASTNLLNFLSFENDNNINSLIVRRGHFLEIPLTARFRNYYFLQVVKTSWVTLNPNSVTSIVFAKFAYKRFSKICWFKKMPWNFFTLKKGAICIHSTKSFH